MLTAGPASREIGAPSPAQKRWRRERSGAEADNGTRVGGGRCAESRSGTAPLPAPPRGAAAGRRAVRHTPRAGREPPPEPDPPPPPVPERLVSLRRVRTR